MIPDQGQCIPPETITKIMTRSILVMEPSLIQRPVNLSPLTSSIAYHMINLAVDRMPSHMVDEP